MVDIHTTLKIHVQYCADFKEETGRGEGPDNRKRITKEHFSPMPGQ